MLLPSRGAGVNITKSSLSLPYSFALILYLCRVEGKNFAQYQHVLMYASTEHTRVLLAFKQLRVPLIKVLISLESLSLGRGGGVRSIESKVCRFPLIFYIDSWCLCGVVGEKLCSIST